MFLSENKKKNSFVIAGLFLSGLVGAGFGSGREIFVYFASVGPVGLVGFFLSCLLLGLSAMRILAIATRENSTHVGQITHSVLRRPFASLLSGVVFLFSFIGYIAMLSGVRDVLCPVFPAVANRYPVVYGLCTSGIVAACALLALWGDFPAFARICAVVTPILIFSVAGVSVAAALSLPAQSSPAPFTLPNTISMLLKSSLYIGYNGLFLLGVLGRAGDMAVSHRAIRRGSLLGAGIFFVCGICIFVSLLAMRPEVAGSSMPLPAVITAFGRVPGRIFACVLAVAMLLCAACNLGAVGSVWGKKPLGSILMALAGIPMSYVGFDRVVSAIYPIFSIAGILFLIALAQTQRKIV